MRKTCDITVGLNLVCMILFFILNCGLTFNRENKRFLQKLSRLMKQGELYMTSVYSSSPDGKSVRSNLKVSNHYLNTMARFHPIGQATHRLKDIDILTTQKAIVSQYFTPQIKKVGKKERRNRGPQRGDLDVIMEEDTRRPGLLDHDEGNDNEVRLPSSFQEKNKLFEDAVENDGW